MSSARDHMMGNPLTRAMAPKSGYEYGTVRDIDPAAQLCSIYTDSGRTLSDMNWPTSGQAPRRGDRVSILSNGGRSIVLPQTSDVYLNDQSIVPPRILYGVPIADADGAYARGLPPGNTGRGDAPPDMLPGDKVLATDEGSVAGVLSGGVAMLKATELAQIVASAAEDLLRLVGRNVEMMTSGGHLKFKEAAGKTSVELRMGVDAENEGDPNVEAWRVAFDLGGSGEVMSFSVTDSQGRALYKSEVDSEGRVYSQSRRVTCIVAEDAEVEVATNLDVRVGGDTRVEATGGVVTITDTSYFLSAGFDVNLSAGRNLTLSSLDTMYVNAGAAIEQVIADGYRTTVARGGVKLKSLDPRSDIEFSSAAGMTAKTVRPVTIGGPRPGLFSTVLYDQLQSFMQSLGTLLDTHVHLSAAPGSPTTTPTVPIYSACAASLPLAKSQYLKTGG